MLISRMESDLRTTAQLDDWRVSTQSGNVDVMATRINLSLERFADDDQS